jgi:phage terminase large subunit
MEADKAQSYEKYANIWLGECASQVEGAIFSAEMKAAMEGGRICRVPVDRTKPVQTFWDLGFGDLTAIWFAQAAGGWYNVVDYIEGNGLTIADWCVKLQQRGYLYGTDWLPHDAVDTIVHARLAGGDRTRSIEQLMRAAGRTVRIAPKLYVTDRLNAARTIFPQCRFDANNCADGLQRLRHYQWGPTTALGVSRREPLHDAASHGADAYCTLAVSIKQPGAPKAPPPKQPQRYMSAWS